MNKNGCIESRGCLPDNVKGRIIEVAAVGAVTMLVRIDMGADLRAAQAELAHTSV
jgi:hypothetical protein